MMKDKTEAKDFSYEIKEVSPNEKKKIKDLLNGNTQLYPSGEALDFIRIGPKGYFMPKYYRTLAADIYNLPLRSDDVFVTSFPKSGTTWVQDLVWLLMNNFDFEKAKSIPLTERFPFMEYSSFVVGANPSIIQEDKLNEGLKGLNPMTVQQINEIPSPRFIKTHLPLSLLPPKILETTKVIHVARDVRDVITSYYFHNIFMKRIAPDTDFKEYAIFLCQINDIKQAADGFQMESELRRGVNTILWISYWSPYFENIFESWEKRDHPNMLFLFYEELSKDLPGSIHRIADFLGKEVTEEDVVQLCEHLKFDNFKKNKSVNMSQMQEAGVCSNDGAFIRKGKAGGWREHFDEELLELTEKWIKDNLKNTDFRFVNV